MPPVFVQLRMMKGWVASAWIKPAIPPIPLIFLPVTFIAPVLWQSLITDASTDEAFCMNAAIPAQYVQSSESSLQLGMYIGLPRITQQPQPISLQLKGKQPLWISVDDVSQGSQGVAVQGHGDTLAHFFPAPGTVEHPFFQVELGFLRRITSADGANVV